MYLKYIASSEAEGSLFVVEIKRIKYNNFGFAVIMLSGNCQAGPYLPAFFF